MRTPCLLQTLAAALMVAAFCLMTDVASQSLSLERPVSTSDKAVVKSTGAQAFPVVERVPNWYLNPPVEPSRIYGVGISDATGSLLKRMRQAEQRAVEDLSRVVNSSVQGMRKEFQEERAEQFSSLLIIRIRSPLIPASRVKIVEHVQNRAGIVFALAASDFSLSGVEIQTGQIQEVNLYVEESSTDEGYRRMQRLIEVRRPSSEISVQISTTDSTEAKGKGSAPSQPDWSNWVGRVPEAEGRIFGVGVGLWDNLYLATLEADTRAREAVVRCARAKVAGATSDSTSISKEVTSMNVSLCPIVRRYVNDEGTVFSLAEVDTAGIAPPKEAVSDSLLYRSRLRKALKELDRIINGLKWE